MNNIQYPESWSDYRTVLAHDWLTGMRGGERCLELLCNGFPDAPLYTLLHKPGAMSEAIERREIHTSPLQRIPGITRNYRYFLPWFTSAVEQLRLPRADLVISTSHCVAKGVRPPPGAKHICYCFTPMRYAWTFYEEYFGTSSLKHFFLDPMLAKIRRWDVKVLSRVDLIIGISHHVCDRIHKHYDRQAELVYPPVDTERCTPSGEDHEGYDLVVSALVPYKRIELAVEAYNQLGTPLKVVGTGTEYEKLVKMAGPNIDFLGWESDENIVELYQNCRCLLFPGEEDFGIVPVEVQSCGRPVVAFGKGGALETVVDGETGVFFKEQTVDALIGAIEECASISWDPAAIRRNAERFTAQKYLDGIDRCIRQVMGGG